ncbi:MAG: tol-pal system protein YbgF [Burkholderiales bacterium]|nr:tol-pal system protein YbgF [Burkholderiales bacterium]MDE1926975.1 tol-pal system protein YbgF [Burkholderiales bacterium]MDE2159679.1 tol-pal system protein YbgF [Burkholderiales bacterium]MDE2503716.1 tol-pal system protein YbgF [Burkholderiales bacterium]
MHLRKPGVAAVAALLILAAGTARAGLFDDDEARKAINDLRSRVAAVEESSKSRADANSAELTDQLGAIRRSLLDLNNQLDSMRSDIAKLRGNDEQLARDVADLQRRQKDVDQAMDDRLRALEPVKVTLDGKDFTVEPDEKHAYDDAIGAIRGGDFAKAVTLLGDFQRRYPASPYGDSVRYWTGNALYGKGSYKEAIAAYRAFVTQSPNHPRAPEALLALANSQAEMKETRAARKTIAELIRNYPQSDAAKAGRERLKSLR